MLRFVNQTRYHAPVKKLIWNRHTKIVIKHITGWLCLVLGLLMCFTPGQGLLTILLGIYLLADDIPFFHRLKIRLEKRFPKATSYGHRKAEQLRALFHRNSDSKKDMG